MPNEQRFLSNNHEHMQLPHLTYSVGLPSKFQLKPSAETFGETFESENFEISTREILVFCNREM